MVVKLKEKFLGGVRGVARFEGMDGVQLELLRKLFPEGRRQVRHLIKRSDLLGVHPLQDLIRPVSWLAQLGEFFTVQ